MSHTMAIVLQPLPGVAIESENLVEHVKTECVADVPNNLLQRFRVTLAHYQRRILVEPFIANCAFQTLWTQPRKRPYLERILRSAIDWSRIHSVSVGLLFRSEGKIADDKIPQRSVRIEEVFSERRPPSNELFLIVE